VSGFKKMLILVTASCYWYSDFSLRHSNNIFSFYVYGDWMNNVVSTSLAACGELRIFQDSWGEEELLLFPKKRGIFSEDPIRFCSR
jgi:hypothetical protein